MRTKLTTLEKLNQAVLDLEKSTNIENIVHKEMSEAYARYKDLNNEEYKTISKHWCELYDARRVMERRVKRLELQYKKEQKSPQEIACEKNLRMKSKQDKALTDEILALIPLKARFVDRQTHSYRINFGHTTTWQKDYKELRKLLDKFGHSYVKIRKINGDDGLIMMDVPFTSFIKGS